MTTKPSQVVSGAQCDILFVVESLDEGLCGVRAP